MEIKGDFLGFEFDGVRSESLGIVRTSGGDRYDENLQPDVKDITTEVPGMDGEYYFGSTFGTRPITVSFAFDSMTEVEFRKMRRVFASKKIAKLVFDEAPYKYYMAKIENPVELSYVCFDAPIKTIGAARDGVRKINNREYTAYDENNEPYTYYARGPEIVTPYIIDTQHIQRIYKGEGTINFICYFPFAKSNYRILPISYANEPWVEASGLLTSTQYNAANVDKFVGSAQTATIKVYNAGDVDTGFRLLCPFVANNVTLNYDNLQIGYTAPDGTQSTLSLANVTKLGNTDKGFMIDTNTGLINGYKNDVWDNYGNLSYKTTGVLYNRFVTSGYFFKLQPNKPDVAGNKTFSDLSIVGGNSNLTIGYDYLYI